MNACHGDAFVVIYFSHRCSHFPNELCTNTYAVGVSYCHLYSTGGQYIGDESVDSPV